MYKPGAGISIHALLAESDSAAPKTRRARSPFLSTLSLRRATNQCKIDEQCCSISIHALLAESDRPPGLLHSWRCYFYPRSPCGERPSKIISSSITIYFYPRSPCGERRPQPPKASVLQQFLSTLSLRRATHYGGVNLFRFQNFYPRSPCGERPAELTTLVNKLFISIHALLAESDCGAKTIPAEVGNFYPRSPCGERPRKSHRWIRPERFLSTLSLRRATRRSAQACKI